MSGVAGTRETADVDDARDARTRILDTAYDLFCRHSVGAVGVDRIIAEAGVAKMTLYRHFASKDDLVLAFLGLREERWTRDWLEAGIERRGATPADRTLAVFDLLDEWFRSDDFESCALARTLVDSFESRGVIYHAAVHHLEVVRAILEDHLREAGVERHADAAYQVQILMLGAILSATRGDLAAGRRAKDVAKLVLGGSRAD